MAASDTTSMVLGAAAAASVAGGAAVLVRLHLLPGGPRPLHDAVSAYGVGPTKGYYRLQVVLTGVGAALLTDALGREPAIGAAVLGWLSAYALSRVLVAGAPGDLPGRPRTRSGTVHLLLAAAAFTSIAVVAPMVGHALSGDPDWQDVAGQITTIGQVVRWTAVATLAVYALPPLRTWFGLVERLLYAASLTWLLVLAIEVWSVRS